MVSSTGGCGWFFGSGRWLRLLGLRAGQPWTAAFAVSFRAAGRWAAIPPRASQGRAQTTTAPTVRRLPVPARRACVASTSLRGSENSSHARSISSVLHAASNPFCPGVFSDLRDTEAKRTAQRSPNTPRVLRAESRAIFSCVKRLHTANKHVFIIRVADPLQFCGCEYGRQPRNGGLGADRGPGDGPDLLL